MSVSGVQLSGERSADVRMLGRPGGRPVLYFHSPAGAGEELDGAADDAATDLDIRLLSIVRRSLADDDAQGRFMALVASDAHLLVEALGLESVAVLGWSGGGPYALAASARLGAAVTEIHLVSPVPGPLSGPGAIRHPSERLAQIADTTSSSGWAQAPGSLRDYMAIVEPWPFDLGSISQPVTIWSPEDDAIVPPRLIDVLARRLPDAEVVAVGGSHGWIAESWRTVLRRITPT